MNLWDLAALRAHELHMPAFLDSLEFFLFEETPPYYSGCCTVPKIRNNLPRNEDVHLVPNFYILVSGSDLCIRTIGLIWNLVHSQSYKIFFLFMVFIEPEHTYTV